jgi:hypothetical protein
VYAKLAGESVSGVERKLHLNAHGAHVEFAARRLLVAGYTGRDQEQVRAHIAELERHGISAPESVPSAYEIDAGWLTTETELAVGPAVSGEVEAALLFPSDELESALVSVTSDFTDRQEERRSIQRSKQQPKPLSRTVWNYSDVAGVWDEIALRSWTATGGKRRLYQSGKLAQILSPASLLGELKNITGGRLQGTVLLLGTVPLLEKEFSFTNHFSCELEAPGQRTLSWSGTLLR